MKKNILILFLILFMGTSDFIFSLSKKTKTTQLSQIKNIDTTQFVLPIYSEIALGEIKPEGWLLDQLQIMNHNSTGHIDEIYDKIKNDNGWLGGNGDGWEETPYWLDGAVPLAYQLNDAKLKAKVLKYINWSINNQRPSGYFGPITKWEKETGKKIDSTNGDKGEDWWPKMVMLKVIQQYYTATKDIRVLDFMTKYFEYQKATLDSCPIGKWTQWSESRGIENVMMIQWLYSINKEASLLKLADKIETQSFNWSEMLGGRDWVIDASVNVDGHDWMKRHGVNVGMGLKAPAINYQRTGNIKYLKELKTGFKDLMSLHGLPNGIFSADEDLHGNAPTQGTELCATVETMYSLENIIAITGDALYMDALEKATFNALPPQTTDDYNEKQYFQIANQIEINRGVYAFSLPFDRQMNNVLGAKSGYTCCYVNMHQGWTKFAQHLWYGTENNGIAALQYAPNTITTHLGSSNEQVTIQEETNYPFDDLITFKIRTRKEVIFPFQFRVPAWCKEAILTINGENTTVQALNQIVIINRTWKDKDIISLKLPMQLKTTSWAENAKAIEYGPLVYGLKMKENWETGNEETEGKYYKVTSNDSWNFGLLQEDLKEPNQNIKIEKKVLQKDFVWNLAHSPLELKVRAKKIPDWKSINGLAYLPVMGRDGVYKGNVAQQIDTITLVPIGFTKLRIVAFPVVK